MFIEEKFKKPKVFVWPLVFLLLTVLDQISKYFAPSIFKNYQFAFSLPVPVFWMFLIYILTLGAIIYYLAVRSHLFSTAEKLSWVLILTGAVLNIGERIALGFVRDFIYISLAGWTGIYNLADGYIIVGIILLIVQSKRQKE